MSLTLQGLELARGDFTLRATWSLPKGSLCALVGPSGCGKSSLLSAVAGFLPLRAGDILVDDIKIAQLPPGARPLSILFQDHNLFPHMTLTQNLGLGLRPNLRLTDAERAAVEEALLKTGLKGLGDRRPAELSGGQQSRAALARALLRARPLLLLDEPFAALGPALRQEMMALTRTITQDTGTTTLMVTHDPQDAKAADFTVLIAEGEALAPVASDVLFADPPEALRNYLG